MSDDRVTPLSLRTPAGGQRSRRSTYSSTSVPRALAYPRSSPTTANQQIYFARLTTPQTAAKAYSPYTQSSLQVWQTTESVASQLVGVAGSFSNLYVNFSVAPGTAGDAYTIAPSISGSDQDLTCQVLNAATSCTDLSNDFPVTQDQLLTIGLYPMYLAL